MNHPPYPLHHPHFNSRHDVPPHLGWMDVLRCNEAKPQKVAAFVARLEVFKCLKGVGFRHTVYRLPRIQHVFFARGG